MSKPRTATRTFRVSSPKWCACCAQEAISYTPISAPAIEIAEWEADLADTPLRQLSQKEINAEVLRGIEKNSQKSRDLVDRHLPAFLRFAGREYIGVQGTQLYRYLESGDISYRMYCFTKD